VTSNSGACITQFRPEIVEFFRELAAEREPVA
jgi:hypothetical protein